MFYSIFTFRNIIVIGILCRISIFVGSIYLPLYSETGISVSPMKVATGIDYSFYAESLDKYIQVGIRGLLSEFIAFYEGPVEAYLGPLIAGPVFPLMILGFDYREGNSLPLSIFYLIMSTALLMLWLYWLRSKGVGNFLLFVFALIPNPIWFMLNPSTELPFALIFAVFYFVYFKTTQKPLDVIVWVTALILLMLTRPNGYSMCLFVVTDIFLRMAIGEKRLKMMLLGASFLLFAFGLYLYPYFITEMRKTVSTVAFFGILQPEYIDGIYSYLPKWMNLVASWISLIFAKILYFCGLRPSYAGVDWSILVLRAGVGVILLPGLLYVAFVCSRRQKFFFACYLGPIILGSSQDRYNFAVQPVLYFFGVTAIVDIVNNLRSGDHSLPVK